MNFNQMLSYRFARKHGLTPWRARKYAVGGVLSISPALDMRALSEDVQQRCVKEAAKDVQQAGRFTRACFRHYYSRRRALYQAAIEYQVALQDTADIERSQEADWRWAKGY